MVSCPNCGHPNADTAKFCAKCGNKLTPAETLVMGLGDPSLSISPSPPVPPREAMPPLGAKEQAGYGAPPIPPAPLPSYAPPAYMPGARPAVDPAESGHRYVAMRTIAGLCNILAWVSVGVAVLMGLVVIVGQASFLGGGFLSVLAGLVFTAISAVLGWIFWRLLGEGIWLALDIEANTRRTAAALERQQH
jgi:hypothetical protein